ncbi:MAG: hypothetical protein LAO21_04325, partial [Acidobacteriia bacterium]|nr:hypothetical protein [Terriglobia bacterium]
MTTFWWNTSLGSECYLQVGTTLGGQEIYSAGQGTGLSAVVWGLPTDGSPVYARLWSNIGGAWLYNDYTYAACTGCMATKAVLTTPAPGATLSSSMATLWWSASVGSECYLQVGTTVGGQQLYSAGQGTGLSAVVWGLPTDGSTVYVRLWSNVSGAWLYNDYTYATCSGCMGTEALMTGPAPGATLGSTVVTFTWSASLASECYLQVGTTLGGQELYSAGEGTSLSSQVVDLPNNGNAVYVRLWSNVDGAWSYKDYTYTACTGCVATKAAMVTPAPGSTLSSTAVTFTWSAGLASEYYLFVGHTAGGQEIYSAAQGTNLTTGVSGLPEDGSTVHVRLWSKIGGAWLFYDYIYTALNAGGFSLDGNWSGLTAQGKPITFTVSGGSVTAISFGVHIAGPGCTTDSTSTTPSMNHLITSNAFSWTYTAGPGGITYTIGGSFSSSSASSGTLDFTLVEIPGVPGCYGSGSTTWSASKI